jgi:hypothetical protein
MESRLIDNGLIVAIWKIKEYPMNIDGKIYRVTEWGQNNNPIGFEFFADVCVKWDNCSHFRFFGQDYKDDIKLDDEENEKDSYYHICGCRDYIEFSSILYFANLTMSMINEKTNTFYDYETDMDIMKDMLDKLGYRIDLVWDETIL